MSTTQHPAIENALAAETTAQAWLRHFSKLVCLATLLLIFLGGQVKSHDAGLSVPDWPLTYGQNPITYPISSWTGGIFHEHFHRLFAGGVATLTVVLAVWLSFGQSQRWIKATGWLSVVAVLAQAVLGGLTVIYQLPVSVSSAHAILAQTFFVLTFVIAFGLSREFRTAPVPAAGSGNGNGNGSGAPQLNSHHSRALLSATLFLIALVYVQLFLGALMRHTESGLAIPDFPKTAGNFVPQFDEKSLQWVNDWRFEHAYYRGVDLPPVTITQMVIHFAHRLGAIAVTLGVALVYMIARAWRLDSPRIYHTAQSLLVVVLLQFTLGAFTVWTVKLPLLTSFHVMTGAALLGVSVLLALRAWTVLRRDTLGHAEAASGSLRAVTT